MTKKIYIITGGTINKVAPHFAVSAPAYGEIGEKIYEELSKNLQLKLILIKTRMSDSKFSHPSFKEAEIKSIETSSDLKKYILWLNTQADTDTIILSSAVADFEIILPVEEQGKRLSSSKDITVTLKPAEKILPLINPRIFTVSFKTLYNESNDNKAFKNEKSSNVVFVNDIGLRKNGLIIDSFLKWNESREETIKELGLIINKRFV